MTARNLTRSKLLCFSCLLCFLCLLVLASASPAQEQAESGAAALRAKLTQQLERLVADFDGVAGIAVRDFTAGDNFEIGAERVFPQASTIKIAILIELYRQAQQGELNPAARVELRAEQVVGGAGVLQRFGAGGSALSLDDLAVLMIVLSDNTATNILIDRVGMDRVNSMLRGHGLRQTVLQRKMMDTEAGRAGRENLSTPREMVTLLERLWRGELLDPARRARVFDVLAFPKSTPLRRGIPAAVSLANKSGSLAGVRTEAAVVALEGRPFAIAVMTSYAADDAAAEKLIEDAGRLVFSYYDRLARSNAYGARPAP